MLEVIKTISIDNVSVDIYSGPIAINCSGGADSSSLLYLLMKYKTDDVIHIFTAGSHNKKRRNPKVVVNVIDRCIELTGNSNIQHHISFCDSLQFKTAADIALGEYVDTGKANILYTGITKNPPTEVTDGFSHPVTQHDRDPNIGEVDVLLCLKKNLKLCNIGRILISIMPCAKTAKAQRNSSFMMAHLMPMASFISATRLTRF